MSNLKKANVEKCLNIISDFHNSLQAGGNAEELNMKKVLAGRALKHLNSFMNDDDSPIEISVNSDDGPPCVVVPKNH